MDAAALFISIVSALATGAATIMAWVSRADALSARESADAAQVAAVEAWERAATALEHANEIQVSTATEAVERERRSRRTETGEPVLRWYVQECLRIGVAGPKAPNRREQLRELTTRLTATGEPAGFLLLTLLERIRKTVVPSEVVSAVYGVQECFTLVREWMANPEQFMTEHAHDVSPDELSDEIAEAVRLAEAAARSAEQAKR